MHAPSAQEGWRFPGQKLLGGPVTAEIVLGAEGDPAVGCRASSCTIPCITLLTVAVISARSCCRMSCFV